MATGTGWAIGQRVRNEAEPSLGLGTIEGFPNARAVRIVFPGAGESRMYNPATAPLRRYELAVGQSAHTTDGRTVQVDRVETGPDGLLTYYSGTTAIPEALLADSSASNDPLQRLLAGELSDASAYDLREACWRLRSETLSQRTRGLTGARVSLLPHQLAIAHTIASREFPRVLLADEVGLGKTIEACLIYAALRTLGRADRVLILTPPSLVHQWLIELYRRFHEFFSVAHSELIPTAGENPFADASRLIAPLDWLLNPERLAQALDEPWDLVIVDEAHHLGWSRTQTSPAYATVEALAQRSRGLLLLTATPLRQGLETEFGLLRLVDPERFASFEVFEKEHGHMKATAALARRLAGGEDVAPELRRLFPEASWDGPAETSLRQLIDRHGTGRVLVRNRRDKLGGFPGRHLHLSVLPVPEAWAKVRAWPEIAQLERQLGRPESSGDVPPLKGDLRADWVLDTVRDLDQQKVVIMASSVAAVKQLETLFRTRYAVKAALFHEGLGLIERDRQAAYFADPDGAQVLITSEVGSEGRNFQFCHHVVMFDLPLHPDALEQRIGRLDRIGQTETIQVHVAVVAGTPGEALFEWHRCLRVFDAPLTGGEYMMETQAARLLDVLKAYTPRRVDALGLAAFLAETTELLACHREEVQAGVDFLIDLNSFDPVLGADLVAEVESLNQPLLTRCVSGLLEHFGVVEGDMADPRLRKIRPGNLMKIDAFPGLRAGGFVATYDRELALAREDLQFLSPDHPLVEGGLALLLDQAEGRATAGRWPEAPAAGVRIDFLFLLEAVGPPRLGLQRFLPPVSLSLTVDLDGQACAPHAATDAKLQPLSPAMWSRLAVLLHTELPSLLDTAADAANAQLDGRRAAAVADAHRVLGGEQERLKALHQLGNVAAREVAVHGLTVDETLRCLAAARVSLDAVRVLVLDPES